MNYVMKINFNKSQLSAILLICIAIVPYNSIANTTKCLHSTDREELKKYAGGYVKAEIIADIKENMDFLSAIYKNEYIDSIGITDKGDVLYGDNYHEAWPWDVNGENFKECISLVDTETIILHFTEISSGKEKEVTQKYVRADSDNFFFNILFHGCFKDSKNDKWCFKDGKILVNKKEYKAAIKSDGIEIASKGNILDIEGEDWYWVFIPIKDGWNVYKTGLATNKEDLHMRLNEPWKILISKEK